MFRSTITFIAIICSVLCFVGAVLFFVGQSSGNATAEAVGFATLGANFGAMVLSAIGLALGSGWWKIATVVTGAVAGMVLGGDLGAHADNQVMVGARMAQSDSLQRWQAENAHGGQGAAKSNANATIESGCHTETGAKWVIRDGRVVSEWVTEQVCSSKG